MEFCIQRLEVKGYLDKNFLSVPSARVQGIRTTKKPISSYLYLICGWLRISLGQTFWLSSNHSAAVVPINGLGAAVVEGAGKGEGCVG